MKQSERKEFQEKFVSREIKVLCACDLLNEGWDCPEIEVLFMARPTMSKVLYTQQLERGMRLYNGKESLMVFLTSWTTRVSTICRSPCTVCSS